MKSEIKQQVKYFYKQYVTLTLEKTGFLLFNPCQPSVAFHRETSHLICIAKWAKSKRN